MCRKFVPMGFAKANRITTTPITHSLVPGDVTRSARWFCGCWHYAAEYSHALGLPSLPWWCELNVAAADCG